MRMDARGASKKGKSAGSTSFRHGLRPHARSAASLQSAIPHKDSAIKIVSTSRGRCLPQCGAKTQAARYYCRFDHSVKEPSLTTELQSPREIRQDLGEKINERSY